MGKNTLVALFLYVCVQQGSEGFGEEIQAGEILLIVFHFMMYFTAVMGFGSATGTPPKIEIIKFLLVFSAIGASPNLLVFLFSAIRRKQIRENALWAFVFSLIVMVSYFVTYWNLLGL